MEDLDNLSCMSKGNSDEYQEDKIILKKNEASKLQG